MGEKASLLLAQAPPPAPGGGISFFIMLGLMLAILYFMLIRPEGQKRKRHQDLINSLKKGDEVVLQSGIFGKIVSVEERFLSLEIADKTRVKVLKSAISALAGAVLEKEDSPAGQGKADAKKAAS